MPLRDHFHLPWSEQNPWEGFHSAWVNTMVRHLNGGLLPGHYRSMPQVHGVFAVRIHDDRRGMKLVATVELVSPGNKDRAENRQAFATKCAAYLQEQVNVVIVDIVTSRHANLHRELLTMLGQAPNGDDGDLYCVAYRNRKEQRKWRLDFWPFTLTLQAAMPTVPLWLADNLSVPLELEKSYEETCQVLRIGPA